MIFRNKLNAAFLASAVSMFVLTGISAQAFMNMSPSDKAAKPPRSMNTSSIKPDGTVWKNDEAVLKYKDESITLGKVKQWWSHKAKNPNAEEFETMEDWAKLSTVSEIGSVHLMAKKARELKLDQGNEYRARYYELLTRVLPEEYAQKIIVKEINPTDAEILTMIPPALPEVQARLFVTNEPAKAKAAWERIKAGEDMEELIKKEGLGLSSEKGGLTAWLNINNTQYFPAPIVQKLLDAKVGELFEPAYQDIGYVVMRVEGKHSAEDVQQAWLKQNREEFVYNLRVKRFTELQEEIFKKAEAVKYDPAKLDLIGKEGGPAMTDTLVTIRDMEFSLNVLMDDLMKMKGHGESPIYNHVVKFLKAAGITEEAIKMGLDKDPKIVAALEIDSERYLSQIYKRKIGDEAAALPVAEEDVKAYFDQNPAEFTEPEKYCQSMIEIKDEKTAKKVTGLLAKKKPDFKKLAKEYSVAESKAQGGDIGCYYESEVPDVIMAELKKLKPGEFGKEPLSVKLKSGEKRWLFVKLDSVSKPALVEYSRVSKPVVEGRIQTQRRSNALANSLKSLAEEFGYENCFVLKSGKE